MGGWFGKSEAWGHRRVFSRMGWALAVLLGIQALSQGLVLLGRPWFPELSSANGFYWLLSILPTYLLAFPAALLIVHTLPAPPGAKPTPMAKGQFLQVFIICLSGLYLSNFVTMLLTGLIGQVRGEELINPVSAMADWPIWFAVLVGCVLAPAAEELLFRKALLTRLKPYGEGFAILTSALLFALLHGNLFQMIYAFTVGVCFAYITLRTGTVWQTMILHALINGVSVALVPLMGLAGARGESILVSAVIFITFFGMYLFYRYRSDITLSPPQDGLTSVEKWGYFLVNPGMTLFCLAALLATWITLIAA